MDLDLFLVTSVCGSIRSRNFWHLFLDKISLKWDMLQTSLLQLITTIITRFLLTLTHSWLHFFDNFLSKFSTSFGACRTIWGHCDFYMILPPRFTCISTIVVISCWIDTLPFFNNRFIVSLVFLLTSHFLM